MITGLRERGGAKPPAPGNYAYAFNCNQQTDRRIHHAMSRRLKQQPASSSGWRRGVVVSGVRRMNEVNARRARLLPGWVTVFGRVYPLGM